MSYSLQAAVRTLKGAKARTGQQLPAVVYGAQGAAESLTLNGSDFLKLYKQAGESSLIDLQVGGKDVGKVLVQVVQHDPVSDRIIHVDLRRIDMNKAMIAPVVLKFVGEAPVIKAQGGTLATSLQTVEVQCLPKDLVSHIDVDLKGLSSFDIVIKIKDLVLPAGIKIISPAAEALVVKVVPAMTEDEIKAMEDANAAPVDLSKIESAKAKKEEEAVEGAEAGAAPAAKEEKKEEKKAEKK